MKPTLIRDIMATRLLTFRPNTKVVPAIKALVDQELSRAPVVDENEKLIWQISRRDMLKAILRPN